jgi:hypothetical protein
LSASTGRLRAPIQDGMTAPTTATAIAAKVATTAIASDAIGRWTLDLVASTPQAGCDHIGYTVRKSDAMPLQQEFYASSGKKLRSLTFSDPVSFGKHVRPSKVKMVCTSS